MRSGLFKLSSFYYLVDGEIRTTGGKTLPYVLLGKKNYPSESLNKLNTKFLIPAELL